MVEVDYAARAKDTVLDALQDLRGGLLDLRPKTLESRIGTVVAIGDGVARVVGLQRAFVGELLDVDDVVGMAESVSEHETRVVMLGPSMHVQAGARVRRHGNMLEVPAGPALIGRIVDPLGRPLDRAGPLSSRRRIQVDGPATPLTQREPVSRPLRTGVFAIDTMIPIGRGQRQLIVGDRSTGKTELGLDILASLDPDTVGIYVAIGRRGADTASHLEWLRQADFFRHGFAVVTDADDPPGLVHLTPYAATAMAESLAERGRDCVVVYDDLTSHADVHRALALLLGRPVGREAHPNDVFYAHARMLERGTQLSHSAGGGSITAFPIIETQLGDLTGYIPTNLVSITDGQIRLDAGLLAAGITPATDIGLSVSRVGGKAQPPLVRALAGSFKNRYAQFLELESFARFGTRLESRAQSVVDWGRRVRRVLGQDRGTSRRWSDTIARLLLVSAERFAALPEDGLEATMDEVLRRLTADHRFDAARLDALEIGRDAAPDLQAAIATAIDGVLPSPTDAQDDGEADG